MPYLVTTKLTLDSWQLCEFGNFLSKRSFWCEKFSNALQIFIKDYIRLFLSFAWKPVVKIHVETGYTSCFTVFFSVRKTLEVFILQNSCAIFLFMVTAVDLPRNTVNTGKYFIVISVTSESNWHYGHSLVVFSRLLLIPFYFCLLILSSIMSWFCCSVVSLV